MLIEPESLIAGFAAAADLVGMEGWPCVLRAETLRAPHKPPALPPGHGAVYVFALSDAYGGATPAGSKTVLKVGRVGPQSAPRFTYQHYNPAAAGSTLAGSLLAYPVLWPWLGITRLTAADVKNWMRANLDRAHIFVPAGHDYVLRSLELYVRARVGSVYEGAA